MDANELYTDLRPENSHRGVILIPDDLDLSYQGQDYRSRSLELYSVPSDTDEVHNDVSISELPRSANQNTGFGNQSCPSSNLHFYPVRLKRKSVCMTYVLTLFLGIFGAHHFYLGRPKFGTLYVFTAGLLGLGYIVDLVRVPWLVENANLELLHPDLRGRKYLSDAFLLWLPPFGLLGFHHFYLGNTCMAFVYIVSLGAVVLGWFLDLCLVPLIWMKTANANYLHVIAAVNDNIPNDYGEEFERPPALSSQDCAIMTSPEVSCPGGPVNTGIILTPPPYSEVDELAHDEHPPSYSEVLAMDTMESVT